MSTEIACPKCRRIYARCRDAFTGPYCECPPVKTTWSDSTSTPNDTPTPDKTGWFDTPEALTRANNHLRAQNERLLDESARRLALLKRAQFYLKNYDSDHALALFSAIDAEGKE